MTKCLQIPIEEAEFAVLQRAARRAGLPLVEWARRVLHEAGARERRSSPIRPQEALADLFAVEAPVADVDTMTRETIRGRYA